MVYFTLESVDTVRISTEIIVSSEAQRRPSPVSVDPLAERLETLGTGVVGDIAERPDADRVVNGNDDGARVRLLVAVGRLWLSS